ncbi:hypothetical protein AWW74_12955 [Streptococcus pneumoniae]|nr:hypothetical protein AWW74_12955 [Streptococcus pneumoniae]
MARWPSGSALPGSGSLVWSGGARFTQAAVDAVGGLLHGQLAQCGEVGRREERLQRLRGLFGHIDLALLQARDQLARRQVDQHDVMQAVEHAIRHGLAYAYAGDAHHHVIEAFQMLDVDRGPDVDAGVQQLHHILPAPLVAAAGCIAMTHRFGSRVREIGEKNVLSQNQFKKLIMAETSMRLKQCWTIKIVVS